MTIQPIFNTFYDVFSVIKNISTSKNTKIDKFTTLFQIRGCNNVNETI